MSKLKGALPKTEIETTKATARLPNLHIEIGHWRSPGGDSEQISITLKAVPSFGEFGRFLEAANPFALWAQAVWLAWFPWQAAARLAELPANNAASLPKPASEVCDRRDREEAPQAAVIFATPMASAARGGKRLRRVRPR